MNLIDILFLIYLLLVLTLMLFSIPMPGNIIIIIFIVPLLLSSFNYLILGIFNINYLSTIDNNILKKIISIMMGLPSILIFLIFLIILYVSLILRDNEKMNNISKLSNMEKIKETVNKFLVNIKK